MSFINPEIVSQHINWWDGKNSDTLLNITYRKKYAGTDSAEQSGLLKPWMEGTAGWWIFVRAILHAHKTGDLSVIDDALDVMEYDLERLDYAGAGYPSVNLNTGAGCIAAFITEYAHFNGHTVWFELANPWDYEKILATPPGYTTNFAETTIQAVLMAAKKFKGRAVLTPLDLGGLGDILSSLRRTDGFLYDIADRPGDVKATLRVIRSIWKNFHDRVNAIIAAANEELFASWTGVLSDEPYYPSQCDASALISPRMFDEFVWPTLSEEISSYKKTMYHLDGSGEIPHVDTLCSNPSLRAIQWVPEPTACHGDDGYMPLYKKIAEQYGKKIVFNAFFNGSREQIKDFLRKVPREAFYMTLWADDYDDAMRLIEMLRK